LVTCARWVVQLRTKELTLKHTIAALSCTAALIASLTACSSGGDKSTPPTRTSGSSPSTTTTTRPTTAPPTSATTPKGLVALDAQSTHNYNGLKFVVNLPADIPAASRPNMRLFSLFLQADGRTTAKNKLDPAIARLASADVVALYKYWTVGESVQGIGTVIYTITKVTSGPHGSPTYFSGCLDQSKLRQVRKNGTHFDDDGNKDNTLKVLATIDLGMTGHTVTKFTFDDGPC
jgi:hypothetical protein